MVNVDLDETISKLKGVIALVHDISTDDCSHEYSYERASILAMILESVILDIEEIKEGGGI